MTIHLKLDLNSPAELDAFGVFCASVATARRAEPKRPSVSDLLYASYGGIDKSSNPTWRAHTASDVDKTASENAADENEDEIIAAEGLRPETVAAEAATAPKPTRERGAPAPGHARRTKAEIAEDKAADEAEAANRAAIVQSAIDETPAISTGEERVGPEDDEATQAADAADEAAETAAAKTGLTLDDLRHASMPYVKKFGMAAASEDVRKLLGFPMADCPDDKLEWAIKTLTDAVASNPLKRTAVGEVPVVQLADTKEDVKRALAAYALKYDGQNTDAKNMPATLEDGPRVLKMRFGDAVDSVGKIPTAPENYAQAVRDIEEMTEKNPWKRDVKVAS